MTRSGGPVWLRPDVLRAIHRRQLAEHGGPEGIRDEGLLESALHRPLQTKHYEPSADLATLAACYAGGLVRNHPFVDGNKRTAYVACRTFLLLNGFEIDATREEKYAAFLDLVERRTSEDEFAGWLRQRLVPPDLEG